MSVLSAIPTTYRGFQFRSRLEAKWAAFFDLVKWPWEYEPFDLSGYIPDFVLRLPYGPVLCEIRPDIESEVQRGMDQIAASGWANEAVVLSGLIELPDHAFPVIGKIGENCPDFQFSFDDCVIHSCVACGRISFSSDEQSFTCRICGVNDGGNHRREAPYIFDLWAQATNEAQWQKSKI